MCRRRWQGERRSTAVALGCLLAAGCTAQLYPGPRRPDAEIAVIERESVRLIEIDRLPIQRGARFEVLPGERALLVAPVTPGADTPGPSEVAVSVRVCVDTLPGHIYRIRSVGSGPSWRPEIVDQGSQQAVAARTIDAALKHCPARSYLAAAPPPATAALPPPIEPEIPRPRRPGSTTIDEEAPPVPFPVGLAGKSGRMVEHPGTGFGFESGWTFGGDKLATAIFSDGHTEDLRAGGGLVVGVEGAVTPSWIDDSIGFGVGIGLGVKYDSIGDANGSISLLRFPVRAFVQAVSPVGQRGSFILRAGVQRDLGVHIDAEAGGAQGSADLSSSYGFVGELGAWYQVSPTFAATLTVVFSHLSYSAGRSSIDASNGGLMFGLVLGSP